MRQDTKKNPDTKSVLHIGRGNAILKHVHAKDHVVIRISDYPEEYTKSIITGVYDVKEGNKTIERLFEIEKNAKADKNYKPSEYDKFLYDRLKFFSFL